MTALEGDRVAAPYLRFHEERIAAMLPTEIERATATHGGRAFSVYLYVDGAVVAEARGCRSVLAAFTQAVHAYRTKGAASRA